jgi:alkanesulfonate monooxygenase SsuD/methylene tetrahydromethanopterin reductase-like flavin-dependent oxidoreductase (luciferase family)
MTILDRSLDETANPLFNDNKMKLATFGTNVSGACAISTAEGTYETSWPNALACAEIADRAGLEGIVPVARWRGFGGQTNFNGVSFETSTFAAGVASSTKHSAVFSTTHVPTIHPIVAAKQASTIDHISNGRYALNVVVGWSASEFAMFGSTLMEHDKRYEYAQEWLDVAKLLWARDEEFDFEGTFFHIKKGFAQPKPIQRPFPAIMNAGGSPAGLRWAAKNSDMAFIVIRDNDYEGARRQIGEMKRMAHDDYERELRVWACGYVVCAPTESEARDYLHYYVIERGDDVAVENLLADSSIDLSAMPPDAAAGIKFGFKAGYSGYPLVGSPEQVVDRMSKLTDAGIAGMVLSWPRYEQDLIYFVDEVLPLMEQAGLRKPFELVE